MERTMATDRISNLPDEVLLQILSLVPSTKQRVSTSILSRRWRYLWTHVPSLDFHPNEYRGSTQYPRIVYRCLLRCRTPCLQRFSASLPRDEEAHDLASHWIGILALKSIQELALGCGGYCFRRVPSAILYCGSSLRVLNLHACTLTTVPWEYHQPWCSFQCLETLVLNGVIMFEMQFQTLLNMCPNLVNLEIGMLRSHFSINKLSSSTNPCLKNLKIRGDPYPVVIDVPNLQYLSLSEHSMKDLHLVGVPQLREVEFYPCYFRWRVPKDFSEVEILSANAKFFQDQKKDFEFRNLKVLHGNKIPCFSLNRFMWFLKRCPSLDTIYITLHREDGKVSNELKVKLERNSQVKSITIIGFSNSSHDMALLKHLLGVMTCLEYLCVVFDEKGNQSISEVHLLEEISQLPRVSLRVNIAIKASSSYSSLPIGKCFDFPNEL